MAFPDGPQVGACVHSASLAEQTASQALRLPSMSETMEQHSGEEEEAYLGEHEVVADLDGPEIGMLHVAPVAGWYPMLDSQTRQ